MEGPSQGPSTVFHLHPVDGRTGDSRATVRLPAVFAEARYENGWIRVLGPVAGRSGASASLDDSLGCRPGMGRHKSRVTALNAAIRMLG